MELDEMGVHKASCTLCGGNKVGGWKLGEEDELKGRRVGVECGDEVLPGKYVPP